MGNGSINTITTHKAQKIKIYFLLISSVNIILNVVVALIDHK